VGGQQPGAVEEAIGVAGEGNIRHRVRRAAVVTERRRRRRKHRPVNTTVPCHQHLGAVGAAAAPQHPPWVGDTKLAAVGSNPAALRVPGARDAEVAVACEGDGVAGDREAPVRADWPQPASKPVASNAAEPVASTVSDRPRTAVRQALIRMTL
jgi:hypothetical protein